MSPTNQITQKNNRLLIIDDDSGIVDYLAEMLTVSGYKVSGETDPQRVLQRL